MKSLVSCALSLAFVAATRSLTDAKLPRRMSRGCGILEIEEASVKVQVTGSVVNLMFCLAVPAVTTRMMVFVRAEVVPVIQKP
jgi:hypothetical protein